MKKRVFMPIIVAISALISIQMTTFASTTDTAFFLNGRERWDAEIIIKEDVTYVPLRIVGEELGASVQYNAAEKSVIITKKNKTLRVELGKKEALFNDVPVELQSTLMMHKNQEGEDLAYVPLRNIFEAFDGVVTYNKENHYINAYNPEHPAYKALEGLKSEDLTTYRFAQIALPRVGEEGMCIRGGRVVQYIFPVNKEADYFFIGIDPSGDMDISTMAYMKVENGVAVCKWYKEVRGDVEGKVNVQDNAINKFLGERTITMEIGTFPKLEEINFISFTNHMMMQPSPDETSLDAYTKTFIDMIGVVTPEGSKSLPEGVLVESPVRSPYLSSYEEKYGADSYTQYYNDDLLSKVDESKLK